MYGLAREKIDASLLSKDRGNALLLSDVWTPAKSSIERVSLFVGFGCGTPRPRSFSCITHRLLRKGSFLTLLSKSLSLIFLVCVASRDCIIIHFERTWLRVRTIRYCLKSYNSLASPRRPRYHQTKDPVKTTFVILISDSNYC